ncbi:MAG: DUF6702 family protein, partial [Gemmatimonadales bacterium]
HPLHTTLTELNYDAPSGRVTITLRLFTEDFANAVGRQAHRPIPGGPDAVIPDSLALAYLRSALGLADRRGTLVALIWAGSRRQGDVSFITLTGTLSAGLSGSRVWNAVNCEVFEDQVNIVRARYGHRDESFLFTRGDPLKALP